MSKRINALLAVLILTVGSFCLASSPSLYSQANWQKFDALLSMQIGRAYDQNINPRQLESTVFVTFTDRASSREVSALINSNVAVRAGVQTMTLKLEQILRLSSYHAVRSIRASTTLRPSPAVTVRN